MRADHPRLIFLGRLDEPRKGLDVLLAAVPLIRKLGLISKSSLRDRETVHSPTGVAVWA
jgi:hypothetical protein